MMLQARLILLLALGGLMGCAGSRPPARSAAPQAAFAIPNPLRPGAKAAVCNTLPETADGCTFHTRKDQVNRVRLPAGRGEFWTAESADRPLLVVRKAKDETANDGARYEIFEVVPSTAKNADALVTFDKLTGGPGALQVIERRRVTVMVHAS